MQLLREINFVTLNITQLSHSLVWKLPAKYFIPGAERVILWHLIGNIVFSSLIMCLLTLCMIFGPCKYFFYFYKVKYTSFTLEVHWSLLARPFPLSYLAPASRLWPGVLARGEKNPAQLSLQLVVNCLTLSETS